MFRKLLLINLLILVTVTSVFLVANSLAKSKDISQLTVWSSYLLKGPFTEINKEFEKIYNCKVIYGRAPEAALDKGLNAFSFSADVVATRTATLQDAETIFRSIEEYKPLLESSWVMINLKEKDLKLKSIEDLAKQDIRIGFCPKRTAYKDLSAVTVEKIVKNAGIKKEFLENVPEEVSCGGVCALVLGSVKADSLDYEAMDRCSYYWQVFSHLLTQKADACIVDEIFTRMPEVENKVKVTSIASEYTPSGANAFSIGVVSYSKQKELAKKYIDFVFSKEGKKIFEKHKMDLIGGSE